MLCHSGWPVNDPDKKEVCFDTMFLVIPDIAVIRQEDIVHLSGAGGCGCGDVQDGEGRIASEKAGPDFRWRKEYGEAERENVQSNLNEVGAHR